MFNTLKQKVHQQFAELVANGPLFTVNPDREKIWEVYINAIPEPLRQEHTCNCCKSFLRQFGGIVGITDNRVRTLWDFDLDGDLAPAVAALRRYVAMLPVADRFLNDYSKLGTDRNLDAKRQVVWTHFHVVAPPASVRLKDAIPTALAQYRDAKALLERGINEITPDAVATVLELIAQGSLYRGSEFLGAVQSFQKAQTAGLAVTPALRSNFCWMQSTALGAAVCGIRNSAIGTLLKDLSEGKELDDAVRAFERVVAPANYKRPTALVTPAWWTPPRRVCWNWG